MNFFDVHLTEEKGKLFVMGKDFKLAVPKDRRQRYFSIKDQNVTLGVRPEHIYDKEIKGAFPNGETLVVKIDVVEPVGSEIIILASCGSDHLTACVSPQTLANPNKNMHLLVDMNQMHLFNRETTKTY